MALHHRRRDSAQWQWAGHQLLLSSGLSLCVYVLKQMWVWGCAFLVHADVCLYTSSLSGSGWCEKGIHQSGREVLPTPKAHWTEENDHGQSSDNVELQLVEVVYSHFHSITFPLI